MSRIDDQSTEEEEEEEAELSRVASAKKGSTFRSSKVAFFAAGDAEIFDSDSDEDCCGCRTPAGESVFDAFARCSDEFGAFAPRKRAVRPPPALPRLPPRRLLDFDSVGDRLEVKEEEEEDVELEFVEEMCRIFLDVIFASQMGRCVEGEDDDGFATPPRTLPLFTGVANTCPGAPVRVPPKTRTFSPGVCRKLEF